MRASAFLVILALLLVAQEVSALSAEFTVTLGTTPERVDPGDVLQLSGTATRRCPDATAVLIEETVPLLVAGNQPILEVSGSPGNLTFAAQGCAAAPSQTLEFAFQVNVTSWIVNEMGLLEVSVWPQEPSGPGLTKSAPAGLVRQMDGPGLSPVPLDVPAGPSLAPGLGPLATAAGLVVALVGRQAGRLD